MEDADRLHALHPFPIIVYAISLALSISYQQLRYSRLSSEQEESRQDFHTGCDILQELRRKWESADEVASLAHRISSVLDQVPCRDMLQASRSDQMERVGSFAGIRGVGVATEGPDGPQSLDLPLEGNATGSQMILPGLEMMDVSSCIDDISWMHVDAENPPSFNSPALVNFDGPYSAW